MTHVPVLVRLDATAAVDLGAQSDGSDVRFVAADQTTLLSHETELYDPGATSFFWVQLPVLQAGAALDFYLYAGNPLATSTSSGPAVFSSNHVGVWHLNLTAANGATVPDASPNGANGTALNMTAGSRVSGFVAGGLSFDGFDDVVRLIGTSGDPELNLRSQMTLSAWIYPLGTGTVVARRSGQGNQYQLQLEPDGVGGLVLSFVRNDGANSACLWAAGTVTTSAWHFVAVTVDDLGFPTLFMQDGVTTTPTVWYGCGAGWRQQNVDVSLGARWSTPPATAWPWAGLLDEVRVENVARSSAWLLLQHASMAGTLLTADAVQHQ